VTPQELTTRARAYVAQALELLSRVETGAAVPADVRGEWVSLRRNIESAQADLEAAAREG